MVLLQNLSHLLIIHLLKNTYMRIKYTHLGLTSLCRIGRSKPCTEHLQKFSFHLSLHFSMISRVRVLTPLTGERELKLQESRTRGSQQSQSSLMLKAYTL